MRYRLLATCSVLCCAASLSAGAAQPTGRDLAQLSIEELANLEISSVSRRAEPVSAAAASIYVIAPQDIRAAGAKSIPEALRLAPNLTVRRADTLGYAISARGFNSFQSSNKILGLIDGRSIYSSLHSGIFWDQYDVLTDDLERIEVISGPGGTLWGANAVNGVINIITKSSRDTQGGLIKLGGGTLDRIAAARYGGAISEDLTYRVYAKGLGRGPLRLPNGRNATDDFTNIQGGFRSDWERGADQVTVQADVFQGDSDTGGEYRSGGNVLARWTHQFAASNLQIQAYYDRVKRISPMVFEGVHTTDVEAQYTARWGGHDLVVGGGYRRTTDTFINNLNVFVFAQPKRSLDLANIYAQDTIALSDTLRFIAGLKAEHNDFTGWEWMPNVRVAWQPSATSLAWAAVSRVVRTPSRIDRELVALPVLAEASNFRSEELLSYEIGTRLQPAPNLSVSVSAFYDVYHRIRATAFRPGNRLPLQFENLHEGHISGIEAWASFSPLPWWRANVGVKAIDKDLRLKAGRTATSTEQSLGNDPDWEALAGSTFMIGNDVDLTINLRFADDLPFPQVPGYTEMDARLAWRVTDALELSIAGTNLLDDQHPETGAAATRLEVPRAVFAGARWLF